MSSTSTVSSNQPSSQPTLLDSPTLPRVRSKPLIRWVGGKRDLAPRIAQCAYEYLAKTGGRYVEPFLGGGAVALELGVPRMLLSDLCIDLINAFDQARRYPTQLLWTLDLLRRRGTDADTYYAIRGEGRPKGKLQWAAWFFYLNATGYNGVWRENADGEYNVPYGKRAPKKSGEVGEFKFPTAEQLKTFTASLGNAELIACDFVQSIRRASAGSLVYCDPPYEGVFDTYLKDGFGLAGHEQLAAELRSLRDRGGAFITTNNDTEAVRRLYDWASIMSTGEQRRINCDASKRGKVNCLLIASDPSLLWTTQPIAHLAEDLAEEDELDEDLNAVDPVESTPARSSEHRQLQSIRSLALIRLHR